jgi:hypothetical protein
MKSTKLYNVTVNEKTGNEIIYPGVEAHNKKEAIANVRQDRVDRKLDYKIKSIKAEVVTDWNA